MTAYIIDFVLLAVLIIGLTALLGVISTTIGEKLFGRKKGNVFFDQNANSQQGWRKMIRDE
jgi:hypothetical protein